MSFVTDPKVQPAHALMHKIHRIPVAKRERVKKKLDDMIEMKMLIEFVEEPTDWCSIREVKPRIC